jgi:hypothetical protein
MTETEEWRLHLKATATAATPAEPKIASFDLPAF